MRNGKRWRRGAWLPIGLLVALAVSAVASDETFCVMQHTGYFNLNGGSLTFWNGTGGYSSEPEFAFITVTIVQLTTPTLVPCGASLPGGICASLPGGGAPSIKLEWIDLSDEKYSPGTVALWGNSYTFYAKWARISGTGQGFYTITFNPCGTE